MIILLDPFPDECEMYVHALQAEGYDPRPCENAEQVIALSRSTPVAAVITRILQRQGIDGIQLTQRLKSEPATRSVPVVIITTQTQPRFRASANGAGCDAFVMLPCEPDALVSELRAVLDRASHERGLDDVPPPGDIPPA